MADYGKLSKRPLDEMIAGARVDVAPYKRDRSGFRVVEALERGRAGMACSSASSDMAGPFAYSTKQISHDG